MRFWLILLVSLVVLMSSSASGRTWYIKADGTGDVPTIQAAVDSALAGDEIVLESGTFRGSGNRAIDVHTDYLYFRSDSEDPAACIIDCEGAGRGFKFYATSGNEAPYRLKGIRLEGITVRNGSADAGAALYCEYGGITVTNCVFEGNRNYAIDLEYSTGVFTDCMFNDNYYFLDAYVSSVWFTQCTFFHNTGMAALWYVAMGYFAECTVYRNGGRFYICDSSYGQFRFCTFWYNNSSRALFELRVLDTEYRDASLDLTNCVVANSYHGYPVYRYPGGDVFISASCTDIHGNAGGDWIGPIASYNGTNGNFSLCPSFCNADFGDFHLCDGSPCLPGNHPTGRNCGVIGAWDAGCSCGPSRTEPSTWGAIKSMYK